MKIYLFEIAQWEEETFERLAQEQTVESIPGKLDADNASRFQDAEVLSVFVYSQVTREVLDQMPKLKAIATRSTGFDHIDMETCQERGIAVCNVPSYGENTVASHTIALILDVTLENIESILAGDPLNQVC